MLRDIGGIVLYGISFSNIRSCIERYNISLSTLKPSNLEVAKAEGREHFKAWTCFMFTQFPCNTYVFGLSFASFFFFLCFFCFVLFAFLFVCLFSVSLFVLLFSYNHVVNALPEFALVLMDRGRFTPSVYMGGPCLRLHFHRISP